MTDQQDMVEAQASRQSVCCPDLPLAVYREVAAHLRQVHGVQTDLVWQTSQTFDYTQSQVEALWIEYPVQPHDNLRQQVDRILAYYGDRYGSWKVVSG